MQQKDVSFSGLAPSGESLVETYTIPARPEAQTPPLPSGHFPQNKVRQPAVNIPAPAPKIEAEKNPDLTSVTPPSQFYFYKFDELSIRKMRGIHQARMNTAASQESLKLTVEAVSSLLSVSAYDLTIPDFYWVLYWLRQNSYLRTPLTHTARCKDTDHLIAVAKGTKPEKSLYSVSIVNSTTLVERPLDIKALEAYVAPPELEGIPLYVCTMRDMVDVLEFEERPDWAEFSWLSDYAAFLGHTDDKGKRLSIEKRIEIAAKMEVDQLSALSEYMSLTSDYGVQEKIKTTCSDCGALIESEVSINANMFL